MLRGNIAEYLKISDDDDDLDNEKRESDSIANQRGVIEYYIRACLKTHSSSLYALAKMKSC